MYNNNSTVALYLDEGSRYLTVSNNVVQDAGVWAFTNADANNNTDSNTFSGNWYNGGATEVATGSPHNNVLSNNVQVSGYNWPSGAQQVISQAGIQSSGGAAGSRPAITGSLSATTACAWTCTGTPPPAVRRSTSGPATASPTSSSSSCPPPAATASCRPRTPAMTWRWPRTPPPQGTPDIVQEPVSGASGSLWLPAQQSDGSWQFKNSEQRPVPGRLRRRQQHRPATRPVALQERPRHQPGLHPQLITRAFRRGGHHRPF